MFAFIHAAPAWIRGTGLLSRSCILLDPPIRVRPSVSGRQLSGAKTSTKSKTASKASATLRDYSWCTTPKYTGDPKEDLLQAVKYNDETAFFNALEELGPDAANTKWDGHRFNQSVLLACCFRGRTRMVEHLVEQGADCRHTNDFGWGAVKYAKQFYYVLNMREEGDSVIRLLVRNGAQEVQEWRGNAGVVEM